MLTRSGKTASSQFINGFLCGIYTTLALIAIVLWRLT